MEQHAVYAKEAHKPTVRKQAMLSWAKARYSNNNRFGLVSSVPVSNANMQNVHPTIQINKPKYDLMAEPSNSD